MAGYEEWYRLARIARRQNGAGLVGKSFPHPVGVFSTLLKGPTGHIRTKSILANFRYSRKKTIQKILLVICCFATTYNFPIY